MPLAQVQGQGKSTNYCTFTDIVPESEPRLKYSHSEDITLHLTASQ